MIPDAMFAPHALHPYRTIAPPPATLFQKMVASGGRTAEDPDEQRAEALRARIRSGDYRVAHLTAVRRRGRVFIALAILGLVLFALAISPRLPIRQAPAGHVHPGAVATAGRLPATRAPFRGGAPSPFLPTA
jgi:hypothetical protein